MTELYHHGIKGMRWGVRKDRFKQTVNKTMGSFLGIENKHLNKMLRSSGKLRKAYFDAQMLDVKTKKGKYKFVNKQENKELYQKQQQAARKAQRYAKDFLDKYGNKPMSYLESINAQRGAGIGTAVGIAVPIVLPLWATIPAGYYIGSHVGGKSMKHSEELMHYGVKGMKWKQHRMAHDERKDTSNNSSRSISDWLEEGRRFVETRANDMEDSVDRHSEVLRNQIDSGRYGAAWGTALTAYRQDSAFRAAVDASVSGALSSLVRDDHWYNRVGGRIWRTVYNTASSVVGSRRATRAEVEAYEREMNNRHRSSGAGRHF